MNLCKFSGNIILLEKNTAFESENIFEIKFGLKNNEKGIIFDSFVSDSDFVLDGGVEVLDIKNFLKNEFFAFFSQNSDKKFILHSIKTPEIYQKSKLPICEGGKFDEIKYFRFCKNFGHGK